MRTFLALGARGGLALLVVLAGCGGRSLAVASDGPGDVRDSSDGGDDTGGFVRVDAAADLDLADAAADAFADDGLFPPPPPVSDAGPDSFGLMCSRGTCDLFDPTSCGAQVCIVGNDGKSTCVAASASPKAEDEPCTAPNDCAAGFGCVAWGGSGSATEKKCHRACPVGSKGLCGEEHRCTFNFDLSCVHYCERRDPPCNIYAQDCADPSQTCLFSRDFETGAHYTGCQPAGTATTGQDCSGVRCARGLICVGSAVDGSHICRQICTADAGALPCLVPGETCSGQTMYDDVVSYCQSTFSGP